MSCARRASPRLADLIDLELEVEAHHHDLDGRG